MSMADDRADAAAAHVRCQHLIDAMRDGTSDAPNKLYQVATNC